MWSDRREIRIERWLGAPREQVFEALTDPASVRSLPGVRSLRVLREDADPDDTGGLGHRREVVLDSGRFVEQITGWDPPRRFEYQIVEASAPIEHELGSVTLHERHGGTAIEWVSVFRVQTPLFANLVARWADEQMEHLLDRHVDSLATSLQAPRVCRHPQAVDAVPPPVGRYLARAGGAADARAIEIDLQGRLKLNEQWYDFESTLAVSSLEGFRWSARVRNGLVRFAGEDSYTAGRGHMLWKLYGLIPVVRGEGVDVTHSARGRAAMEQVFLPCALARPEVDWRLTPDGWCRARWVLDGHEVHLELDLDAEGRLRAVRTQRWSDAEGEPWHEVTFGGEVVGEVDCDGLRLPETVTAGWFFGGERWEEGRFFEATVLSARVQGGDVAPTTGQP